MTDLSQIYRAHGLRHLHAGRGGLFAKGPSVALPLFTNISAVIEGVEFVIRYTINIDLSAGEAGFAWSIGVDEPTVIWWGVPGDVAGEQEIRLPIADTGAVPGDTVNFDPGYSLTSPAGVIVYASAPPLSLPVLVIVLEAQYMLPGWGYINVVGPGEFMIPGFGYVNL